MLELNDMVATDTQRIERLEQGIADLLASLSVEVSLTVRALQQTLAAQIATRLESATKELGEKVTRARDRSP